MSKLDDIEITLNRKDIGLDILVLRLPQATKQQIKELMLELHAQISIDPTVTWRNEEAAFRQKVEEL